MNKNEIKKKQFHFIQKNGNLFVTFQMYFTDTAFQINYVSVMIWLQIF